MNGRIHSFETLGAVDGPGIRYVIFMQGCTLKCQYCQNRDTWDIHSGTEYSVEELMSRILRYQSYFKASGGGVTVSGGEPLLQASFLVSLFKELKQKGISTAIDTSGCFTLTPTILELITLTDLFLLDIKCINDTICQSLTGVSNKKELAFATYLSSIGKPMWIRQVLVPGITDHEEDLIELRNFISKLNSVEKVEILPYHDLGKFKWTNCGLKYPLENTPSANSEDIKRAKRLLGL